MPNWSTNPIEMEKWMTKLAFLMEIDQAMKDTTDSAYDIEVFYDGGCPLCLREITMLRRWDRQSKIRFTDIDAADFQPAAVGKSYEELMAQMHGRLADGTWVQGVEVFRQLYAAVGFVRLTALSRLPLISQVLNLGYSVFARNRLRLTGRCTKQSCSTEHLAARPSLIGWSRRMSELALLFVHLVSTLLMVGIIWFVQVVHYPLLVCVGAEHFGRYAQLHQSAHQSGRSGAHACRSALRNLSVRVVSAVTQLTGILGGGSPTGNDLGLDCLVASSAPSSTCPRI